MSNGDINNVLGNDFDPSQYDDNQFGTIPAGWYPVEIESAELKQTKRGDGYYLNIRFNIIGEQYNGRKLFDRINLQNPNQKATEIGQAQLATLAKACGLPVVKDSDELLGKTCEARVKVTQDEQYGEDNEVTTYRATGEGQQGNTPSQAPQQSQAQDQPQSQEQQAAEPAPANAGNDSGEEQKKPPWLQK